jgi:hypothetical protein
MKTTVVVDPITPVTLMIATATMSMVVTAVVIADMSTMGQAS